MALTQVDSASAPSALTLDTPSTLSTQTTAGTYILRLDLDNLAAGDVLICRIKTKVVSGGTSRVEHEVAYAHAQSEKHAISDPIPVVHEIVCELEQTDGTGRVVPWSLLRG